MNNTRAAQTTINRAGGITPEFFDRIVAQIATAPEMRLDRIAEARSLLLANGPSAHDVASKIVDRVISDALR